VREGGEELRFIVQTYVAGLRNRRSAPKLLYSLPNQEPAIRSFKRPRGLAKESNKKPEDLWRERVRRALLRYEGAKGVREVAVSEKVRHLLSSQDEGLALRAYRLAIREETTALRGIRSHAQGVYQSGCFRQDPAKRIVVPNGLCDAG
jgi:hypothetical protein